jgi:long-chain acyl-CoA synthetase
MFTNIEDTAKAFAAMGVQAGDIVVLVTVNMPETVYAFYGLNRLGAISNMVDPRTSTEGIHEYIKEVNAKYLLTIDVALQKIEKAVEGTKVENIVVISPAESLNSCKKLLFNVQNYIKGNRNKKLSDKCIKWEMFIRLGKGVVAEYVSYKKNACCAIVHTGGTTGMPKGVMLSNDNLNALVLQSILTDIDMKREHSWLDIMPPFIAYGIGMGLCLPLIIGMETILIPSFNPKKFDELLLRYKPVHMVFVPSYWGTIIKSRKLKNKDLSYIIAPTVGGDAMEIELEEKANRFLKEHGCAYAVTKGYGMTEVCAGVAGTVDQNNEIGSVGIPFVKTIISVFDTETGEELKYNQIGEICISGPNVMLGYYGNPDATDEILRKHEDGNRWIHSGDIGYINEKGSIFIVDRMKRIIIRYDGFKIFPSIVEKAIMQHVGVEACCTVGIPDKAHSQGKLPIVYIVLNSKFLDKESDVRAEITEICSKELPEYAQPVDYKFCSNLPLTPIGKIDYRTLEKEAVGGEAVCHGYKSCI